MLSAFPRRGTAEEEISDLLSLLASRTVGVLLGGESPEREASLYTAKHVLLALERAGITSLPIDPAQPERLIEALTEVDIVFNALHGGDGESGVIQGLLNTLRIPYTGADLLCSAVAMHKPTFKALLRDRGIPTPASYSPKDCQLALQAGKRIVSKPVAGGGSLGMSLLEGSDTTSHSFGTAHQADLLFEEFICGRNVTAGLLQIGDCLATLPLVEIELPTGAKLYDTECKYGELATLIVKPTLPSSVQTAIIAISREVFAMLRCRDYARLDFIIGSQDTFLLELNTLPGLYPGSNFCEATGACSIGTDETILLVLAAAARRADFEPVV